MATVNNRDYQHATIALKLVAEGATLTIAKFDAIDYEVGAEKKHVHNAQGKPVGYTIDNAKPAGNITCKLSEWHRIEDFAEEQYPDLGLLQIEWEMSVTYGHSQQTLKTDKLEGVMFQKATRKSQNNQDALTVEIPLFLLDVDFGGKRAMKYEDQ